ncbi:UNKNOWN [Stylonychia lemnae]|uniref:STEEP1 domain-containing protein n=1 Tax=Stylonychia lemnae TaxID=5949 RepID=A0A078AH30_STYLE|nr:UNKNOWN [Stylonychia lemnae]|eukprot:CDW81136.1 UNKNOWN [Stylonychia lemnae]
MSQRYRNQPVFKPQEQLSFDQIEKEYHTYYCAVCGAIALVTSIKLDELLLRRSDNAYILECDQHYHKKFLSKQTKFTVIHRETGVEKQYRWRCKECQGVVGYQTYEYEDTDIIVGPGSASGKNQQQMQEDRDNRKHFYLKSNALVKNAEDSELLIQAKEFREQMSR